MRIIFFLLSCCSSLFSLEALYLTYPKAPTESIAVHWIDGGESKKPIVVYRSSEECAWKEQKAEVSAVGSFFLNRSAIYGLEADTEYVFRICGQDREYRFRTLPIDVKKEVHIAIGGDVYYKVAACRKMNEQVARHSPDFVILGGDLSYMTREKEPVLRWIAFLKQWHETMHTPDGRVIPIVGLVGNHDVQKKKNKGSSPEWFYDFFPYLEKKSYGTLDIGSHVSFFLLDTGHLAPIRGEQTLWLEEALKKKDGVPLKIAVYHVAAYPSVYLFNAKEPTLIRNTWCPLFEQYGIQVAFEHHNHAFKRTYPMKAGHVDPSGIVYIGDGGWGVSPRQSWGGNWYLARKKQSSCCSFLTVSEEDFVVETINANGKVIDCWKKKKPGP